MADTNFTPRVTKIVSTWLQDINDFVYRANSSISGVTSSLYRKALVKAAENVAFTDFGADDTGVSSSITAWDVAKTSVQTSGRALHMTAGTYLLTGLTKVTATIDLVIRGEGEATLNASTAGDLINAGGGDISLFNLSFGAFSHVIYAPQTDSGYTTALLRFEDCAVSGAFDVLFHERPLSDAYIVGSTFDSLTGVPIKLGYNNYALQENWKNFKIALNRAASLVPASAIDTYFAQIDGKYHVVALNQADTITGNGAGETWGVYTKARYSVVLANVISTISTTGSGNPAAYQVKGAGRGDVANGVQGFSTVHALNIGVGTGGTTQRGLETHVEDAVTIGNLFENFGQYGMLVGDPTAGEVRGLHALNKIIGTGLANNFGIHESSTNDDIILIGHAIRTVDRGVNLSGSGRNRHLIGNNITDAIGVANYVSGSVDLFTAVGNVVDGATRALYMSGGTITRALIVGNNFDAVTDAADVSGIYPEGTIKSGLIANNAPNTLQTTDATTTNAWKTVLPDETVVVIEATVIAVQSDGSNRALYRKQGLFYRTAAGVATQQGATQDVTADIESDATWGGVTLTVTGNTARVQVQGKAATTINWSVDVKAHFRPTA